MPKTTTIKAKYCYLSPFIIKLSLFLFILASIWWVLDKKILDLKGIQNEMTSLFESPKRVTILLFIVFLTPLNWAFEAKKWQLLVSKIEQISFPNAYKSILAGLALGFSTPLGSGDWAGRILMLQNKKRVASLGGIFLGNGLQLFVSLAFGTVAYLVFFIQKKPNPFFLHLAFIGIFVVACLFFSWILTQRKQLENILKRNRFSEKIIPYVAVLQHYSSAEISRIGLFCGLRYLVFLSQFVMMLFLFESSLPLSVLMMGVALIFLAKTVIPIINFASDLGVRELASLYFFSFYGVSQTPIATATLLIWVLNLLVPVLIGSLFVFKIKIS